MKDLSRYTIPSIFEEQLTDWHKIDVYGDIMGDFSESVDKLNIEGIYLDDGFDWQEEEGIIDLQLYHEGEFRNCIGNFYITWDQAGKFSNIWYSGQDEKDGYHSWKWKDGKEEDIG